jgi:hypothetical protein
MLLRTCRKVTELALLGFILSKPKVRRQRELVASGLDDVLPHSRYTVIRNYEIFPVFIINVIHEILVPEKAIPATAPAPSAFSASLSGEISLTMFWRFAAALATARRSALRFRRMVTIAPVLLPPEITVGCAAGCSKNKRSEAKDEQHRQIRNARTRMGGGFARR